MGRRVLGSGKALDGSGNAPGVRRRAVLSLAGGRRAET